MDMLAPLLSGLLSERQITPQFALKSKMNETSLSKKDDTWIIGLFNTCGVLLLHMNDKWKIARVHTYTSVVIIINHHRHNT